MGEDNERLDLDQLLDAAIDRRRARHEAGRQGRKSIFIESAEGELFSFAIEPSINGNGASSNGNSATPTESSEVETDDPSLA